MNPLAHLSRTYRQLRLTAGWTLIAAPLLILAVAYLAEPTIKPTLSHYYFAEREPGLIRTLFTGFLIFVGGILVAYRGFDSRDNWIHNAAGVFAICVALFPKRCDSTGDLSVDLSVDPYCTPGLLSSLHLPAAILVFVFAACAVVYCGGAKLKNQLQDEEIRLLNRARKASLIAMIAGVALYVARGFLPTSIQAFKATILMVELLGFYGFAAHWLVLTWVIDNANQRIRVHQDIPILPVRALTTEMEPSAQPVSPVVSDTGGEEVLAIP